jgi:CHAT domain
MAPARYRRNEIEIVDRAAAWIAKHPEEPWRKHPARCFVLVEHGRAGLVHRAYERGRFLRLVARVRRSDQRLSRSQVSRILGFDRPAALVGPRARPAGEAVVFARDEVVGAWATAPARRRALAKRAASLPGAGAALGERSAPFPRGSSRFGSFRFLYAPDLVTRSWRRSAGVSEPHRDDLSEHHDLSPAQQRQEIIEEVVRRTPHIRLPSKPIEPGQRFKVKVFADASKKPLPGETGEDIVIAAPRGRDHFELLAFLLPSDHFAVRSEALGHLVIARSIAKSEPIEFELEAKKSSKGIEGAPSVSVNFLYHGRPAGRVRREVNLVGMKAPGRKGGRGSHLEVQSLAEPPDVTVVIARAGDGQSFHCLVEAPGVPGFETPVTELWGMRGGAEAIVRERMKGFVAKGLTPRKRKARLCGVGMSLFEQAPSNVQAVLRAVDEAGTEGLSVLIATEEAAMPWEILITPGHSDPDPVPLGVRHAIARWTHSERSTFPPFKLERSRVVAPTYKGKRELKWSSDESAFVRKRLKGTLIRPASFEGLDDALQARAPSLLHFICHGAAAEGAATTIWLDADEPLTSDDLRGMPGARKAFAATNPIVFMNACEVGRPVPALVGADGFAQALIDLGARAVIAPMWSVKDALAHEAAIEFYTAALEDRQRPFADILREIRKKTYTGQGGEDSYAAYCFYGDPLMPLRARKR